MFVAVAGDAAVEGPPCPRVAPVSRRAGLTELPHVAVGAHAALHVVGRRAARTLARRLQLDVVYESHSCTHIHITALIVYIIVIIVLI